MDKDKTWLQKNAEPLFWVGGLVFGALTFFAWKSDLDAMELRVDKNVDKIHRIDVNVAFMRARQDPKYKVPDFLKNETNK